MPAAASPPHAPTTLRKLSFDTASYVAPTLPYAVFSDATHGVDMGLTLSLIHGHLNSLSRIV